MPLGTVLVMVNAAAAITMVSSAVTFCAGLPESVTLTVMGELPAVVGVPLTVQPASARPAGNVPAEIEQLYGVVPPLAVIVEL